MDPLLKGFTEGVIGGVIPLPENPRNFGCLKAHHYPLDFTGKEIPESRNAVGIYDGNAKQGMELFPQHLDGLRQTSGFRTQEIFIGRLLSFMLGPREAGAFKKIHHTGWMTDEFFTGLARGYQILAFLSGMPLQVLGVMAPQEGKVQRPPGQPDYRHPDEFPF
jgi:hypothetical protein